MRAQSGVGHAIARRPAGRIERPERRRKMPVAIPHRSDALVWQAEHQDEHDADEDVRRGANAKDNMVERAAQWARTGVVPYPRTLPKVLG